MAALEPGFVHRDYQSRNLMWRGDRLTVIDFQDALRGPLVYDLVALLCDSYVDLDAALQDAMIAACAGGATRRRRAAAGVLCVAAQRKLKDAGRFVFIDRVRKNPDFLRWYPQSLVYAGRALRTSGYLELSALIERHLPGFPITRRYQRQRRHTDRWRLEARRQRLAGDAPLGRGLAAVEGTSTLPAFTMVPLLPALSVVVLSALLPHGPSDAHARQGATLIDWRTCAPGALCAGAGGIAEGSAPAPLREDDLPWCVSADDPRCAPLHPDAGRVGNDTTVAFPASQPYAQAAPPAPAHSATWTPRSGLAPRSVSVTESNDLRAARRPLSCHAGGFRRILAGCSAREWKQSHHGERASRRTRRPFPLRKPFNLKRRPFRRCRELPDASAHGDLP